MTITISDLRPVGSDLFLDRESYMNDLSDSELHIQGGFISGFITTPIITILTPSFGTPIISDPAPVL